MTVYVIGCEGSRLVKIGSATDLERRRRSLATMSANPVTVLWQSTKEHGRRTEAKLHEAFRGYRQHGEWFDFGEEDPVALMEVEIKRITQTNSPVRPSWPKKPKERPGAKLALVTDWDGTSEWVYTWEMYASGG